MSERSDAVWLLPLIFGFIAGAGTMFLALAHAGYLR